LTSIKDRNCEVKIHPKNLKSSVLLNAKLDSTEVFSRSEVAAKGFVYVLGINDRSVGVISLESIGVDFVGVLTFVGQAHDSVAPAGILFHHNH
jgi:hypothetical protein